MAWAPVAPPPAAGAAMYAYGQGGGTGGGGGGSTSSGPAFSAKPTSQQAIPGSTYTKLNFGAEDFDTAGAFSTATSRFQPTTAGYYLITGQVTFTAASGIELSIYKNGTFYKAGTVGGVTGSVAQEAVAVSVVYLNGSTDYVELWAYTSSAQSTHASYAAGYTHFSGAMVTTNGGVGVTNLVTATATSGTAPASYATLLTASIVITGSRVVLDGLVAAIKDTALGTVWLKLQVDGVDVAEVAVSTNTGYGMSIPIRAVVTGLAAGSRTVTLQWKRDSAGASTSYALLTAEEK